MKKTSKKKAFGRKIQSTKAKRAFSNLIDRDPYEGMTPSERKAQAESEEAQRPLNMLRERLMSAHGLQLPDAALRRHLDPQHPLLLRAFLSVHPESSNNSQQLVIDTAAANIARLESRSASLRAKTRAHYLAIVEDVKRVVDEWKEQGRKKIQNKDIDAEVASRRTRSGDKYCDARTVRRARKTFGL